MVLDAIRFNRRNGIDSQSPGASLEILDQLLLPHRTTYVSISTCEDAHAAIRGMQVRGAPAIAIVAALALAVQISKEADRGQLPGSASSLSELIGQRLDYLQTSRPTAVNLGDAVGKLKKVVEIAASGPDATPGLLVSAYMDAAEQMLADDVSDNQAIGQHGALWIERNTAAGVRRTSDESQQLKVLTHCNTG